MLVGCLQTDPENDVNIYHESFDFDSFMKGQSAFTTTSLKVLVKVRSLPNNSEYVCH